MKNLKNIPTEILIDIFEKLRCSDNVQCSMTCRSWKSAAQYIIFQNIPELTDKKLEDLLLSLSFYQGKPFDTSYIESPGNFVRTLDCSCLSVNIDVEQIDSSFPFLESIDNCVDRELSFMICQLITKGKFVNLTCIPDNEVNDTYAKALLTRKDTIRTLHLVETPIFSSTMYRIMQQFHIFPKLTFLRLEISDENALRYLKQLSHLVFVDVCFTYTELTETLLLDDDKVEPLTSVREAKIKNEQYFSGGNKPYYCIMKVFPNVKKINVDFGNDDDCQIQNYAVPTVACISQFLTYLFNIKEKSIVTPIITDGITTEVVESFFAYVLHYRSLTKRNVRIHLGVSFDRNQSHSSDIEPSIRETYIKASNRHDSSNDFCEIDVRYKFKPEDSIKPLLELIEKVQQMEITSLDIGDDALHYMLNNWNTKFPSSTIFDTCTKFKQLRFYHMNMTCGEERYSSPVEQSVTAIETLEFSFCDFYEDMFPEISKRCPDIKSLTISGNGDGFRVDGKWIRSVRVLPIVMPSTCLQELTFVIRRPYSNYTPHLQLIIELITANEKPRYCRLIENQLHFLESCTENDYKSSLKNELHIVYDIFCERVENLIVENISGFPSKQIFTSKSFPEQDL